MTTQTLWSLEINEHREWNWFEETVPPHNYYKWGVLNVWTNILQ